MIDSKFSEPLQELNSLDSIKLDLKQVDNSMNSEKSNEISFE